MNGTEALAKCLEAEHVEYVFGYPGVAICPFFDALYDTGIKTILVRQEQNAAHEASGYARISGKVGVAVVTSGPGAINLITGIATAFADSIPLVCISGQVESRLLGTDGFQEADISGAVESFVKYSYIVRNPADLPRVIKEAFYIANTGRKGPVLIDLPFDIQKAEIKKFEYPETVDLRTYKPTVEGNIVQIKKVLKQLGKAKRPVLVVGGGAHLSDSVEDIQQFVKNWNIPTVVTMMGLGAMPTMDKNCYGMVGNNGSKTAMHALKYADTIVMAGARVADRTIQDPDLIQDHKVLIHMDVDPAEIGKNAGPTIPLVGSLKSIFEAFNAQEVQGDYKEWIEELNACREEESKRTYPTPAYGVDPRAFIRKLSLAMDDDGIYSADVGQNQILSCQNVVIRKGRFMTSGGMGTMGYALPASIGAKIAAPSRQSVAVCGDGAFQMTMMELSTAQQYDVPVKLVVMCNQTLGLVRQFQHSANHDRYIVTDLSVTPDLNKIAEAYHMNYIKVEKDEDVESAIAAFLKDDESALLECTVDKNIWV